MADSFVNVKVGAGASAAEPGSQPRIPASPRREPAPPRREDPEREEEVTRVEARRDASAPEEQPPARKPSLREIVDRGATLLDVGAGAADGLGADGAADVMRKTAQVARTGAQAAEAIKREVEPLKDATRGLWKSMEDRGWVGMRPPMNIAQMQGRDRPRRPKKSEG